MIARRAGFRSVFLLVLASALWLGASFPTDDAGRPAPWCSYVDDSITPAVSVVCSVTRPLPFGSSGVTSIATDTLGYGRTFFLSPSGSTGGANPQSAAFFVDESNVVSFGYGGLFPSGNLRVATSSDGGRTWNGLTALGCPTGGACQGILTKVVRTVASIPTYVLSGGNNAAGTIFRSTSPTGGFTATTIANLDSSGSPGIDLAVQGAAVMVVGIDFPNSVACRSDDAGATFQPCVTYSAGVSATNGAVVSPSLNIWLASDANGEVFRSTNNGATWTQVLTTGGGGGFFTCLSATVCLWNNAVNTYRSTDAGATWVIPGGAPGGGGTFCNFGSNVVDVLGTSAFPTTSTTTTTPGFRSTDGGISWTQVTVTGGLAAFINPTSVSQCVTNTTGRSVFFAFRSADNVTAAYFGPTSANTVQIVGANGIPLSVDGNGNFTGNQGLPQAIAGNGWPVSPVQGAALFNSSTTGAAATPVVVTIAAVASQRVHLRGVEAYCSAAPAAAISVTVTDGATVRWTSTPSAVAAIFNRSFLPSIDATTGNALTVTLPSCGGAATGTLNVHADQGG